MQLLKFPDLFHYLYFQVQTPHLIQIMDLPKILHCQMDQEINFISMCHFDKRTIFITRCEISVTTQYFLIIYLVFFAERELEGDHNDFVNIFFKELCSLDIFHLYFNIH